MLAPADNYVAVSASPALDLTHGVRKEGSDVTEVFPLLCLGCYNTSQPLGSASAQEGVPEPLTQVLDIWLARLELANRQQLREHKHLLEEQIRKHIQALLQQAVHGTGATGLGLEREERGTSLLESAREAVQAAQSGAGDEKAILQVLRPFELKFDPDEEDVPPEHCTEDALPPCTGLAESVLLGDSPADAKGETPTSARSTGKSEEETRDSKRDSAISNDSNESGYKVHANLAPVPAVQASRRNSGGRRSSGGSSRWFGRLRDSSSGRNSSCRTSNSSAGTSRKSMASNFFLTRASTMHAERSTSQRRGEAFQKHVQTTFRRRQALVERDMVQMDFFFVSYFVQLVSSLPFKIATAVLILGNAAFIGIQTNWNSELAYTQGDSDASLWQVFEVAFVIAFSLELFIRLAAYRWTFFYNSEWRWNVFDFTIVLLSVLEVAQNQVLRGNSINFPILRLIRVTRVLRILKFINMVPFFRHLTVMVTSVADSLQAFLPAVALLLLIVYCFGITILQGVVNYLNDEERAGGNEVADLRPRFGSFTSTMLTLILAITSGNSWVESFDLLSRISPVYQATFLIYVVFVQIGVLNIVTGIFVDTVHQMFKPDREDVIEKEARKRKEQINDIVEIFMEADADQSGQLTLQEFRDHLQKEDIQIYFQSMHLDVTEAQEVFKLMDVDDTGTVDLQEFVDGFLCLRGQARSVDLWQMRHLLKNHTVRLKRFMNTLSTELSSISESLRQIKAGPEGAEAAASRQIRRSDVKAENKACRSGSALSLGVEAPSKGALRSGSGLSLGGEAPSKGALRSSSALSLGGEAPSRSNRIRVSFENVSQGSSNSGEGT